ncbi:ComEC family competence protein [Mucilaginibacter mali]|uniref:ComEC family competence protein n=1 Tax=Mucilaginibacter mali TaxID=2740462 RepID=A0A7D4TPP4_9SPHI|nr:ComEC/Rec2 family competence protein [Mucilaginibacter mali]QKJ30854.1 ComEC family competence protein [Mucilaginibacter mali]
MLADHKGEIPFVVYLLPFMLGIALVLQFNLAIYQQVLLISFFILLAGFIALNVFYQQTGLYRKPWVGGILAHLLILVAGILCTINYDSRNQTAYFTKFAAKHLLVKVNSEPQFKNNMLRFTASAITSGDSTTNKHEASGNLLVVMRADSAHAHDLSYGDVLLVQAKYTPVDPPFNPAEFNYKQYLAHQDIYMQTFLNPGEAVTVMHNAGNPVIAYSLQLRQRLVARFKQYMHSAEAVSVASTLILGYKAELDNDILQAYSKTGTIHVLSVSGAHVAIIFVMIGWLLGFMDRYRYGKLLKAIFTIALIWYYSLLTGLSPAVCRAAVMISFIIIGKTYNRRISTLNILAASAFFILLIDPFLITDVGFQLSYLAVAGLIVFQPIIYNWLDIQNKWLDKLWLPCSASIAAQAITFPLSAYYFHQFPLCFLLSNLFILLPSLVIMYAGIACLLFAQMAISVLAQFSGWVLEKSILLMDRGLQIIERASYASIGKIWLTRGEYIVLFVLLILVFCLLYYKKPALLKAIFAGALILSVSLGFKRINGTRTNSITFFSLKKQPAILFKQGSRAVLLTDLSDTDKTYRYSIQPCLDSNRVKQLSIVGFKKDTATAFFRKQGQLVRFLDWDILVIGRASQLKPRYAPVKINYLFVTGDPKVPGAVIDTAFTFNTLILAADNSDRFLAAFKPTVKNNVEKMYVLKRNKSLILLSN